MEYQILFNVAFAVAGALAGFVLNNLWQSMKELQKADAMLADKIASIEILVAGQYVKRDAFDAKVDALFAKLDQMDSKFESNLDLETDKFGVIPFTASPNDSEKHGRDLFTQAVAGDFGPIAGRPIAAVKAEKIAALEADRKRLETLPITGNQGGTLFTLSRPEKIQEFLMGGLSIALDPSPAATFSMLDDNGVEVTYSKTLMGQIISFINASKQPALARYNTRKQAIEAAKDAADLARVDTDLTKP